MRGPGLPATPSLGYLGGGGGGGDIQCTYSETHKRGGGGLHASKPPSSIYSDTFPILTFANMVLPVPGGPYMSTF